MQHIEDNREQHIEDTHREQTQNNTKNNAHRTHTERTQNSAHNYRTYSFDLYHEQIYIKNSNTIEIYTILND